MVLRITGNLAEGSNLYYTNARADARVVAVMDSDRLDLLAKDYATITGTQTLTNKTITAPNISSPIFRDSAGNQSTMHMHEYSGISFNTEASLATLIILYITLVVTRPEIQLFLLVKMISLIMQIGISGVQAANDFVIGYEGNATNFKIKRDIGANYDLSTGTTLFSVDSTGIVDIPSNIQSTNKTTGALVVAGGVGVSGDIRASEIITSGNVQAQGNFIGNVTGQVSTLSNHNTGGLSEGTNKYYTSTRVDSDFDARLATKNTGNLTEGGNLYYTTARADSDAKNAVTVTDAGGDGSLSYNASNGTITYQGPVASDTRAHFSGGTGVTITGGSIAIGQDVSTSSVVTFAGGSTISGNLNVSGDLVVGGRSD